MTGKSKLLVLVLAAASFVGAISASPATAQSGKLTSDGPVTLEISHAGGWNAFTVLGYSVECPFSTYTGHQVGSSKAIPSGSTTFTVTPTYKNCTSWSSGFYSTTIDMNGCDYVMHIGFGIEPYNVSTDIVCPAEKDIQITVFSSSSHTFKLCTVTIKPQVGLTGGGIKNTTGIVNDTEVSGTFRYLKVEQSGLCGSQTSELGEIDVGLTLRGVNSSGETTGVQVSS